MKKNEKKTKWLKVNALLSIYMREKKARSLTNGYLSSRLAKRITSRYVDYTFNPNIFSSKTSSTIN